jgi:hypothetical protein
MINDISDKVLAARLLLADIASEFSWRKLRDYSGTVSQMVQPGAPMSVLLLRWRPSWNFRWRSQSPLARSRVSFRCTLGFLYAGNCAYRTSILDNYRYESSRQHGRLL